MTDRRRQQQTASQKQPDLPGSSLEMLAQRFPSIFWARQMTRSSSAVQLLFFTVGFRWLCHRSRICLPLRLCMCLAMSDQRLVPNLSTRSITCRGRTPLFPFPPGYNHLILNIMGVKSGKGEAQEELVFQLHPGLKDRLIFLPLQKH